MKSSDRVRNHLTDRGTDRALTAHHSHVLNDIEGRASSSNNIERISAEHELELLEAFSNEALLELRFEHEIPGGKKIDFFFAQSEIGIEAYAPNKRAMPGAEITPEMSDADMQRALNAVIRLSANDFADDQAERLCERVNKKCEDKGLSQVGFPVMVFLDSRPNDIAHQYSTPMSEQYINRAKHFAQLASSSDYDYLSSCSSNVIVALRVECQDSVHVEVYPREGQHLDKEIMDKFKKAFHEWDLHEAELVADE